MNKKQIESVMHLFPQKAISGYYTILNKGVASPVKDYEFKNMFSELFKLNVSDGEYLISKSLYDGNGHGVTNLLWLTNVVIDVDCHSSEITDEFRMQVLKVFNNKICEMISGKSYKIDSTILTGRGFHYCLSLEPTEANEENLILYKMIAEEIVEDFDLVRKSDSVLEKYINIDLGSSKDPTGYIRLIDSQNSNVPGFSVKMQNIKSVLPCTQKLNHLYLKVNDLYEFNDSSMPGFVDTLILNRKQSQNRRISSSAYSEEETSFMLKRRLFFLEEVQNIRKNGLKDGYSNSEYRKVTLFLYYSTVYELYKDFVMADSYAKTFNNNFDNPLCREKLHGVLNALKSGIDRTGKGRWFQNKTFVKILDLNEYEEMLLKESKKLLYSKDSLERKQKREKRKQNLEIQQNSMKELYKNGYSYSEIATRLKCSRSKVAEILEGVELTKTDETYRQVQRCKIKGFTQEKTSEKLKLHIQTVKKYWK